MNFQKLEQIIKMCKTFYKNFSVFTNVYVRRQSGSFTEVCDRHPHYNHKSLARVRQQALITFDIIFLYSAPSRNERIAVLHHYRNRAIHLHQYHSTSSS